MPEHQRNRGKQVQRGTGGAPFNNLLAEAAPPVDFAAHAASLGAEAVAVDGIAGLEDALPRAFRSKRTTVLVVATDPQVSTQEGGAWWDVPVTALPRDAAQERARADYETNRARQRLGA